MRRIPCVISPTPTPLALRARRSAARLAATALLAALPLALFCVSNAHALSTRQLFAPTGETGSNSFGISVGTAGDVNGDGFADVIVGAILYNGSQGRAYVYYGGPDADTVADLTLTGEGPSNSFGASVGTAGDVNGDGYADVIVGAWGYNSNRGRAYVYYGGPGADAVADLTLTGEASGNQFGTSVGRAGDVNGDGYADVIVGARGYNISQGRAYVYYGGPGADTVADRTLTGQVGGDNFGASVGTAGDVNGDGHADVIVGATGYNSSQGRAYVYHGGPGADVVADLTLTGEAISNSFGGSVGTAGDVSGDGYADVIVGAVGYNGSQGRAYLYYGGPGADAVADLTLTGETSGDSFGASVGTAGDVNGDGWSDVIVGAFGYGSTDQGRAYVYYGGPGANTVVDLMLAGEAGANFFGYSVGAAGDVNGDGYADVIVGAYGYESSKGRAYVRACYPYQILSPNGGEQWVAGKPATVRWLGHDVADISLSTDGGLTYTTIAAQVGGAEENQLTVTAPSVATAFAKIRVSYAGMTAQRSTSDASDAVFSIVEPHDPPAAAHQLLRTMTGEGVNNYFGTSVGTAGDVNGDGHADVIVGANGYNGSQGRAYVYHGGPGADMVADLTLTGEAGGTDFGGSVGTAGDVNGDGYADVIVGAYGAPGRAYVYYCGPVADAVADLTLSGEAIDDYFGKSVGTAGDVNGDGYADVIVGAATYNAGQGRAYVYHGGPGADTVADLTLTGEGGSTYFGVSVGTAGDVNGDGHADVIVAAHNHNNGRGRAYVYHGGPGADTMADLTLTGEASLSFFGVSVGTAGDVNGDGYADVIVGAAGYNANQGRAYLYLGGPGADAVADLTLTGEVGGTEFGGSVGTAGDVNGDGYADVIVGASALNVGQGRAYLYFGGPGADPVADLTLTGETSQNAFGYSVGTAGDVNGDGHADVIVGAYLYGGFDGRAYLYEFNRYIVTSPNGGETWNVGAVKTISWLGAEPADVWLSVNAGQTYDLLATGLGGSESNSWPLRVPHSPGKFTMVKVTPTDAAIGGSDQSDSLFTIQTSVSLLALLAAPMPDRPGAAVISWRTDPGPADLAGYRLEKSAQGGAWRALVSLTTETSFTDEAAGSAGARYRLFAVNGLNEELLLGETSLRAMRSLAAWPLPYRGGELTLSFATANALGGGLAPAEVSVFDVSGRLVRTVAKGEYGAGYQTAVWNGMDASGRRVSAGIYFIRARSAGQVETLKLAVLR